MRTKGIGMRLILVFIFLNSAVFAGNLSSLLGGGGSSSGVTWAGYTASLYDGGRSNLKGFNALCHAEFSGSHGCTYDEIIKLGNSYPFSANAWVVDGMRVIGRDGSSFSMAPSDGGTFPTTGTYPNCSGWASISSSNYGAVINTAGKIEVTGCNITKQIPCCK